MRPPGRDGARAPDPDPSTPRLVVIGNFDGVHTGHQAVLRAAAEEAVRRGLELTVLTFDPHPAEVLARKSRAVLTRTPRKVRLLEETVPGLCVVVKHFDVALAALGPEEFAAQVLKRDLNAQVVLVGENFRFGHGRAGDLSTLQSLGAKLGFEAWAETLRGDESGPFSSTRIRALLGTGRVVSAATMLTRPHLLTGIVSPGDGRGRQLGFPTANLSEVSEALPQDGVYAVFAYELTDGAARLLGPGVANLGARPTVDRPSALEVHLLDFDADLYGKHLGVTLVEHIRPTQKFADLDALCAQVRLDIDTARGLTAAGPSEALIWA